MTEDTLRHNLYASLMDLVSDEGINASGRGEIYGCIFGRDSAITILKLLNVVKKGQQIPYIDYINLLEVCKRSLLTLCALAGRQYNPHSGEAPGKFIHEYRKNKYEHLVALDPKWYVYPDGILRNYDSLDATPLALIAIHKYWQVTRDNTFLLRAMPAVEAGLKWIINNADSDDDYLVEYELPLTRRYGGLKVQSWTDSHESLQRPDGTMPAYPIAPCEVQGYAWLALRLWSDVYNNTLVHDGPAYVFGALLARVAKHMRRRFNETFIFQESGAHFVAQALDGAKSQIKTVTGNPLLLLWATYTNGQERESIIDAEYIDDLVARAFEADMFHRRAGIRTMSTRSATFNPAQDSYHNGSFWPKLNGMIHEGLHIWRYQKKAELLRAATLLPIMHFGTPIELYTLDKADNYVEYKNNQGQVSCRVQAWSAAAALDLLI